MEKKFRIFKILSMAGFAVTSASVILTPWSYAFDPYNGSRLVSLISALLFWAGVVIGIVFEILSGVERKKLSESISGRIGILNIFKNVESVVADIVIVATIVGYILFENPYVQTVCLAGIIAGVFYHCIFNGLNYRTLKAGFKKEGKSEEDHNEKD